MTTVASGKVGTGLITLTANTVETVTFTSEDIPRVEVVSPASNTADVWYTNDGNDPTVAGAGAYYLPPGSVDSREPPTAGATVIKLISSGTPTVRVQRGF